MMNSKLEKLVDLIFKKLENYKAKEIFLEKELELRKINGLPPFQRFISLILTGENENNLEKEALKFKLLTLC